MFSNILHRPKEGLIFQVVGQLAVVGQLKLLHTLYFDSLQTESSKFGIFSCKGVESYFLHISTAVHFLLTYVKIHGYVGLRFLDLSSQAVNSLFENFEHIYGSVHFQAFTAHGDHHSPQEDPGLIVDFLVHVRGMKLNILEFKRTMRITVVPRFVQRSCNFPHLFFKIWSACGLILILVGH